MCYIRAIAIADVLAKGYPDLMPEGLPSSGRREVSNSRGPLEHLPLIPRLWTNSYGSY